jgi:CBS domain-containing protein
LVILVKDIMSKPVITIEQTKTAKDAGALMKKYRKGCLVITKKRKPVGIISDSDLIKKVIAADLKSSKVKLSKIMSRPILVVKPDEDVMQAAKKMKNSNIHRLPVLENDKVVGLLSLSDIARASPEMINLLESRLKMKEEQLIIKEDATTGICDNCGNYSDVLKFVNDEWACEDCREELEED